MISLLPITIADEAVKKLYEDAFPYEERRDWENLLALIASGKLSLLHISRDHAFAGFLCYWTLPDFTFIEYFAIHPDARGGGIGSQIMQQLGTKFGNIVLEVEPPLTEQAIRRIAFYERLGYQVFSQAYQQPPYHDNYPPLELRLMQKGFTSDEASFLRIKDQLYKHVYNK
ncbi:GNAT family N-acetyltransferase [Chitinophaga sp. MM2321]|uniref:GNAT family N-acetyltransferase n=1 Tax=Chitinophaga sp. MM2321 TaxID=3137178 RepID=UPI0032D57AF5